jgi:hypothetical protein
VAGDVTVDLRLQFISEYLSGLFSMTELATQYRISRKTGYKWAERYEAGGPGALHDQSRRPRAKHASGLGLLLIRRGRSPSCVASGAVRSTDLAAMRTHRKSPDQVGTCTGRSFRARVGWVRMVHAPGAIGRAGCRNYAACRFGASRRCCAGLEGEQARAIL